MAQPQLKQAVRKVDPSGRLLSELKSRVGKCVTFGCSHPAQFNQLSRVIRMQARYWRSMLAGREGFLTVPERVGMYQHRIAWGDQDSMGHVNNVVYNRWAETARINWARNFALRLDPEHKKEWEELWTPKGVGFILRSINTEFKFPLRFPDRVTVAHRLLKKPTEGMDALQLGVVVLSETHQRIAARLTEDIVVYDYRLGKKVPLPPYMFKSLDELWQAQSAEVRLAKQRGATAQASVRKVEKTTWDKEDAVEDHGSAGAFVGAEGKISHNKTGAFRTLKLDLDENSDLDLNVDEVDDIGLSVDGDDVDSIKSEGETEHNPVSEKSSMRAG